MFSSFERNRTHHMAPTISLQNLTSISINNNPLLKILVAITLFSFFYLLSSYNSNSIFFLTSLSLRQNNTTHKNPSFYYGFCPTNFTNYCPCEDPRRQRLFRKLVRKERHCPPSNQRLRCLIERPEGYRDPFPWPTSRDKAWFKNVPSTKLAEYKKLQNWVRLEGEILVFPGGGTSFVEGVNGYVDDLKQVLPLELGNIRTALDVGCGVASFGASLMDYDILTMSIAPSDEHEAQVQFALERGLPAMLGVLSNHRLPFPSRSFDMAHCSRCLVQWTSYDGLYLMEIDRVLHPGGYWVLSGPPINWRVNYKGWETDPEVLEKEQSNLEELAKQLCWEKVSESDNIAVWQKPTNHMQCNQKMKTWRSLEFCNSSDADAGWYTKMTACILPLPEVKVVDEVSGGALEKWPVRLNTAPPRIRNDNIDGISITTFNEDNQTWKRRVLYYGVIVKSLSSGKYRNVMDMNAGIGGFAAAMVKYPIWVMNVVPFDAKNSSLGAIYERGLIGTYMDWCEPFSTYPRTYDMLHASGVFRMYMDKCDIADILLEMHRILRPGGAVIIRDHLDVLSKVRVIMEQMRWKGNILQSENGPIHSEKLLLVDNSDFE